MTIIHEDGSGKTDAESFCPVAYANDYHAKHGNEAWADLDLAQKEAALRRATQYMEGAYRQRWKGVLLRYNQALAWPRADVSFEGLNWPIDQLPPEVLKACAMLALRASAGPLAADLERGVVAESVGSVTIRYDHATPQYTRYREVDMLLARLLKGSEQMVPLGRS